MIQKVWYLHFTQYIYIYIYIYNHIYILYYDWFILEYMPYRLHVYYHFTALLYTNIIKYLDESRNLLEWVWLHSWVTWKRWSQRHWWHSPQANCPGIEGHRIWWPHQIATVGIKSWGTSAGNPGKTRWKMVEKPGNLALNILERMKMNVQVILKQLLVVLEPLPSKLWKSLGIYIWLQFKLQLKSSYSKTTRLV